MIVFDDYGDSNYIEQRRLVDAYFAQQNATLFALPTAQALAIKPAVNSGRASAAQREPANRELEIGTDQQGARG